MTRHPPTSTLFPYTTLSRSTAAGAVDGLKGLSVARRNEYVASIEAVARLVGGGAAEVGLRGRVEIGPANSVDVHASMKISDAADAARKVGKMLVTAHFDALNGHCIQDIET